MSRNGGEEVMEEGEAKDFGRRGNFGRGEGLREEKGVGKKGDGAERWRRERSMAVGDDDIGGTWVGGRTLEGGSGSWERNSMGSGINASGMSSLGHHSQFQGISVRLGIMLSGWR